MGIFYGVMEDLVPNSDNTLGFQLNMDDYDEVKFTKIVNIYNNFDMKIMDDEIAKNKDSQLSVAYQLLKIEMKYFTDIRNLVSTELVKIIEKHYQDDDEKHPDIHEEYNEVVNIEIE
jgi:hypothetical protein